jgi:hypothetical protein
MGAALVATETVATPLDEKAPTPVTEDSGGMVPLLMYSPSSSNFRVFAQ